MGAAHGDEATATSPGEGDYFLYLVDGLRLDVQLGAGVEGLRPCVVDMRRRGAEGDGGV